MTSLPTEIVQIILSFLSQRELFFVSTLCQQWAFLSNEALYSSVDIYSRKQLSGLIHCLRANHNRKSINEIKNGHLIKQISFQKWNIKLSKKAIRSLQSLCPMIISIDTLAPPKFQDSFRLLPGWKHLRRLPEWHKDVGEDWFPILGNQLDRISCFQHQLTFLPLFITHQTPCFPHLAHLKIVINQYVPLSIGLPWLEMIHEQCPSLISLCLDFYHGSVDRSDTMKQHDWVPATNLRTFEWNVDTTTQPIWYTYFSRKYPNVDDLILFIPSHAAVDLDELGWEEQQNAIALRQCISRQSIYQWITNYSQLTSLRLRSYNTSLCVFQFFPWHDLARWLTSKANRLRNLQWQLRTSEGKTPFSESFYAQHIQSDNLDLIDPLGKLASFSKLKYDVPSKPAGPLLDLFDGKLTLVNITFLHLDFGYGHKAVDLNTLLLGCPQLVTLWLDKLDLTEFVPPQHPCQHKRLSNLHLIRVKLDSFSTLSQLLNQCAGVKNLVCRSVGIRQHQHNSDTGRGNDDGDSSYNNNDDNSSNTRQPSLSASPTVVDAPQHMFSSLLFNSIYYYDEIHMPRQHFEVLHIKQLLGSDRLWSLDIRGNGVPVSWSDLKDEEAIVLVVNCALSISEDHILK